MEKLNKRVEILTHIASLKIMDSEDSEMIDVLFNQGELYPFKFDGDKFYLQVIKREALKKYNEKKLAETNKLNRPKTETEQMQDIKEKQELPTELQEITLLYSDEIEGDIKNLKEYILAIIANI